LGEEYFVGEGGRHKAGYDDGHKQIDNGNSGIGSNYARISGQQVKHEVIMRLGTRYVTIQEFVWWWIQIKALWIK